MSQNTLATLWSLTRWMLFLPVVLPLIYFSGIYYPFVVPKVVYFRTVIEFSLAFFAVYVFFQGRNVDFSVLKRKATWLPAIFLGASYFSSLLGIDFYHSFWSTYERMDGLFTLTHLVVYFYLALLVFKSKDWRLFWVANAVVGSLVALYAVGQHFGLAWFLDKADPRVKGTIGNPAFLASYLAMTIFFAFELAREAKQVFLRYSWWFAVVIHILAIIWSQTRGIFVAALAGLVVLLAYTAWNSRENLQKWAIGGFVALAVTSVVFYMYRGEVARSGVPMLSRIASISITDPTTQSRLFVWGEALGASLERPVFGYGLENFGYVYNRFYDPQRIGEEWFDRSHNVYVDELIHGGVVGLGVYLAIIAVMFAALWRHRRTDETKATALLVLLVVYATQNFFVFDTINSSFLFWVLLAYTLSLSLGVEKTETHGKADSVTSLAFAYRAPVVLLGAGAVLSGYFANILPIRANIALAEGYMYQIADVDRSVKALERGLSYGTFGDIGYGYQIYDMYKNKLEYGKMSVAEMKKSYDFSEKLLSDLIGKYPTDARLYIYWGHVVEGRPKDISYDEKLFTERMERAIELSPQRPQAHYMLANVHLNKLSSAPAKEKSELNKKAIAVLKAYADSVPHFSEPQFVVANVAMRAGDKKLAEEYFQKGDKVYTPDFGPAKRAVGYLILAQDNKRAERYFKDMVLFQPGNLDAMVDLAKVYVLNQKYDEAVEVLNAVNEKDPQFLQKEPELVNNLLKLYGR